MSKINKCVLFGLNYKGSSAELRGCINDNENLKDFVIDIGYFSTKDNIELMNDNKRCKNKPKKQNMLDKFNEVVEYCKSTKKPINLLMAYSGHGYHIRDRDGDEADGWDEVLCPLDYETAGFIDDDYIFHNFINLLPVNVTLVLIIDACHSGTITDLKYNYIVQTNRYRSNTKRPNTKCNCVMISGCRDDQTSADAYIRDKKSRRMEYQGAMTASFIANYKHGISYKNLVVNMRKWLKRNRYTQVPQLSTGKKVNLNGPFMLNGFK
jgi:hypothetical protein